MSCVPIETCAFELGPRDYLNQFQILINTLRRGESRYVTLLQAKIQDTLPVMTSPFALPSPLQYPVDRVVAYAESSASSSSSPYGSPILPLQMPFIHFHNSPVTPASSVTSVPASMAFSLLPVVTTAPEHWMSFDDGFSG